MWRAGIGAARVLKYKLSTSPSGHPLAGALSVGLAQHTPVTVTSTRAQDYNTRFENKASAIKSACLFLAGAEGGTFGGHGTALATTGRRGPHRHSLHLLEWNVAFPFACLTGTAALLHLVGAIKGTGGTDEAAAAQAIHERRDGGA